VNFFKISTFYSKIQSKFSIKTNLGFWTNVQKITLDTPLCRGGGMTLRPVGAVIAFFLTFSPTITIPTYAYFGFFLGIDALEYPENERTTTRQYPEETLKC
jgi:hypothetical protein